jgi:hypothetical protein
MKEVALRKSKMGSRFHLTSHSHSSLYPNTYIYSMVPGLLTTFICASDGYGLKTICLKTGNWFFKHADIVLTRDY